VVEAPLPRRGERRHVAALLRRAPPNAKARTPRDIHTELADLNQEAVELAAKIQENFAELGA